MFPLIDSSVANWILCLFGHNRGHETHRHRGPGAKAQSWKTEPWTAGRVDELIERRFRITSHPERLASAEPARTMRLRPAPTPGGLTNFTPEDTAGLRAAVTAS